MDPDDEIPLGSYLSKGEGQNIEFKQTLNDEFKIARTLCSLANTAGGVLLIGIRDDKVVLGVDPDEERYFLTKAAENHCKPPVIIDIHEMYIPDEANEFLEKVVLRVFVPESEQKPHFAEDKNGEWRPYYRKKDQTIIAGEDVLAQMQRDKGGQ